MIPENTSVLHVAMVLGVDDGGTAEVEVPLTTTCFDVHSVIISTENLLQPDQDFIYV